MSIGFIGLGNIGKPMARQLLKLGKPVWVYDVSDAPVKELAALGARPAETPGELARNCWHVGLCVRDDDDVEQLLFGTHGLLENLAADSIIAVHSTVTQASILDWAQDAVAQKIHLVDAPITGGAAGAEAGTLCYMVGGSAQIVERCRPLFLTSGSKIVYAGDIGAGIALKLCNNLMTYAAFAAVSEAHALARACGLNPELLGEVGRSNGVVTAQMEAFIANRDKIAASGAEALQKFFGPFGALGEKDLAAALRTAESLGLKLPATERVHELIQDVFLNRV